MSKDSVDQLRALIKEFESKLSNLRMLNRKLEAFDKIQGTPILRPDVPLMFEAMEGNLTARECEILCNLVTGLSNKMIADKLFITEKTVKFHLTKIYYKIGAKSRSQAILKAVEAMSKLNKLPTPRIPESAPTIDDIV